MRLNFLFFVALFFSLPALAQIQIDTPAKQAYMIDYDTGAVLFDKNANERMPTSSMSKVMTMYMVFDALKHGKLTLDTALPVSENAWRMQGSKMFVELDKQIRVEDLIRGVIIQSGNDATIVLAEGISGTESAFAQAMTAKAKELGMASSNFMNASGWPDDNHYSTAHDLAVMARALIHDFPGNYPYYSEKEFTYNKITQANRNPLLYKNIGADGVKTGHTEAGGYGLIGSGVQNGRRVIFVINGLEDNNARAQEATKMLEYGLKSFANKKLFGKGQVVLSVPVSMGAASGVALVMGQDAVVTHSVTGLGAVTAKLNYKTPLIAPVVKGQKVGTLSLTIGANGTPQEFPVFAGADVPEAGFFGSMAQKFSSIFGG